MDKTAHIEEIKNKSSKGIKWQGIAEIFIRLFQFGTTILLARLLLPEDFGLISVALIFTQLAYVVFDFGFSSALIQKKDITRVHFSTTFVIYLISALFFIFLVFILSPLASGFFRQDALQEILKTLSIVFLLYALSAIPYVRLIRNMQFKLLSILQIFGVLSYGIVTILLAFNGAGVWSFVYGSLAEQLILTILLNVFSPWRPDFRFNKNLFRELFNFGGNVMGTRISGYINSNAPNFIIGRILGTVQLGFYSIAYQLVEFPVQRISKTILKVMFPAFSKLQDDPENYRQLYKKTIYHLALITFPVFSGLVLIAPQFVNLFYGPKWIDAIIPIQLLTATGLFRSFWATASVILLSKGQPQIEFKTNLIMLLFLIPAIIAATRFGIIGVAIAIAVVMFVFMIFIQIRSLKIIGLTLFDFMNCVRLPAAGVLAFIGVNVLAQFYLYNPLSEMNRLLMAVLASVPIYAIIILYFDRNILKKFAKFLGA